MSNKKRTHQRIVLWLWRFGTVFYFYILLYTVFFAGRRRGEKEDISTHTVHFDPLVRKWEAWQQNVSLDGLYLDVMGNVVMFVPFSLVMYVVFRIKNLYLILLLGFLSSLSIETVQYLFRIGVTDVDDLIFNTLGALIGILVIGALKIVIREENMSEIARPGQNSF